MNHDPAQHHPFGRVVEVPRTAHSDPAAETFAANLTTTLLALVPMWIATISTWTADQRQRATAAAAQTIASHADTLQFGGTTRGQTLNALAEGLAILAHAQGGVTALGIHACLQPHTDCPGERRDPHPTPPTPATTTEPGPAPMATLRIEPTELHAALHNTYKHDNLLQSDLFANTADWNRAWPLLLADAAQEVDEDDLLINPATGHTLALIAPNHDRAAEGLPITVEIQDPDTDDVMATHTYTSPLPERPGRTDPGTWQCAATDATHILLTVLSDLNRANATPRQ